MCCQKTCCGTTGYREKIWINLNILPAASPPILVVVGILTSITYHENTCGLRQLHLPVWGFNANSQCLCCPWKKQWRWGKKSSNRGCESVKHERLSAASRSQAPRNASYIYNCLHRRIKSLMTWICLGLNFQAGVVWLGLIDSVWTKSKPTPSCFFYSNIPDCCAKTHDITFFQISPENRFKPVRKAGRENWNDKYKTFVTLADLFLFFPIHVGRHCSQHEAD